MKRVVVSVFDSASQLYGSPFVVTAPGQAMRQFVDEVNRQAQENPLYMHPDDFSLFRLGTFDDENGSFENDPELLMRGKDAKTITQ